MEFIDPEFMEDLTDVRLNCHYQAIWRWYSKKSGWEGVWQMPGYKHFPLLTKETLTKICEGLGVPATGNKSAMIRALLLEYSHARTQHELNHPRVPWTLVT